MTRHAAVNSLGFPHVLCGLIHWFLVHESDAQASMPTQVCARCDEKADQCHAMLIRVECTMQFLARRGKVQRAEANSAPLGLPPAQVYSQL